MFSTNFFYQETQNISQLISTLLSPSISASQLTPSCGVSTRNIARNEFYRGVSCDYELPLLITAD